MIRIGFVVEQTLGHITHTDNLRANIPKDPTVEAQWALIPFATEGLAARVPVYRSNWTVRAGLRARASLRQLVARSPLDALLFHTQVPAVLCGTWIRRYPTVISLDATPRQYDALGAAYAHGASAAWLESLKWRLNRDCFREARHLVTWSQWAKQGLIDEYEVHADKITVIPPGVNVQDWRTQAPRAIRPGPRKLLFVGGDFARKGGPVLLEAWRRLVARDDERARSVELHLVTRDAIPAERGLFVHGSMRPNSPELKQLYADSDVFVLPTLGDCLPMVLSEAAAAGLPAVSTNVAAIGEITRDGETGFLVPTGDALALEAALWRLVSDDQLRLSFGERAITAVSSQFDAERNARRLVDVIKRAAASPR